MVSGFLGEDLSVFRIFCWESFLWFRHLCLHGQVGGHGQLVEGGSSKRSDEMRAASVYAVDDKRINCSFRELLGELSREVPARPVCSSWFRVVSFRGFTAEVVGRVFLVR